MLKLSFIPLAMILLLGFAPESFSETELKTVEIFVQPPTALVLKFLIKCTLKAPQLSRTQL